MIRSVGEDMNDTIVAIATAVSNAGIAIIRISGPSAISVADLLFQSKTNKILSLQPSHTIHYGYISDGQNILDEVMVSIMRAPATYTREDVVEINCHGGSIVVHSILSLIVRNGVRIAEPGEFTKRAYLHGRIDLSQAEAVMQLIRAESDMAHKNAIGQLQGKLFRVINNIRNQILYEIAYIESVLDDPEHYDFDGYPEHLAERLNEVSKQMDILMQSAKTGRWLQEGIKTVIVGKPNAGKSSVLNSILREDRAIVTEVPGTTRDVLVEKVRVRDIVLRIMDTAGIRDTQDVVEKIGVSKAIQYAKDADLIIYVVDSSVPLDEEDQAIANIVKGIPTIVLLNKSDLKQMVTEEEIQAVLPSASVIKTISNQGYGIDALEDRIEQLFMDGCVEETEIAITSVRHLESLNQATESIRLVRHSMQEGLPEDFYTIDLMNAYKELGYIIGEELEDDLVNKIFQEFCTGK